VRIQIGLDITLRQARDRAAQLSARYQSGSTDLKDVLAAEEREAQLRAEEEARAATAEEARKRATLGALLDGYVGQLRADRKFSVRAVESAFNRHIKNAWPELWTRPAQDVTTDDLVNVLNRLVSDGKRREAAKLRSYLITAYADAIRSRQDPTMSKDLRELRITSNPARELATVRDSSRPRQRHLSEAELRAFWRRLLKRDDMSGPVLRFYLLTGGQRVEQLARVTEHDIDLEAGAMTVWDPKGRRPMPRRHNIPLIKEAMLEMQAMDRRLGPYVFTCRNGRGGVSSGYVSRHVKQIAQDMLEHNELPGGIFTPVDLRRTIETRLAALGFSDEVRGQVQSHGQSGVQNRHYNRYDYLQEKRQALQKLLDLMQGESTQQK
jgi:hypothetical protein